MPHVDQISPVDGLTLVERFQAVVVASCEADRMTEAEGTAQTEYDRMINALRSTYGRLPDPDGLDPDSLGLVGARALRLAACQEDRSVAAQKLDNLRKARHAAVCSLIGYEATVTTLEGFADTIQIIEGEAELRGTTRRASGIILPPSGDELGLAYSAGGRADRVVKVISNTGLPMVEIVIGELKAPAIRQRRKVANV